jgi:hypothetical protein
MAEENQRVNPIRENKVCICGRSPTGKCIGWHALTEDQYRQRISSNPTPYTGEDLDEVGGQE